MIDRFCVRSARRTRLIDHRNGEGELRVRVVIVVCCSVPIIVKHPRNSEMGRVLTPINGFHSMSVADTSCCEMLGRMVFAVI